MSTAQYQSVTQVPVSTAPSRQGFLGALAGELTRALDTVLLWQERAAERHRMLGFSEHLLKDIGLSRADVQAEASKAFWRA